MAQEPSSNIFGCFPLVIIAVAIGFLTFLGFRQSAATIVEPVAPVEAQAGGSVDGAESLTVIETVETQVSATKPATITLHVKGYQPDGCKPPVQVNQTRSGDTVTVKIYRVKQIGVLCTMDLNPYDDTITLDGSFDSGTYMVDVNGTMVVVHV